MPHRNILNSSQVPIIEPKGKKCPRKQTRNTLIQQTVRSLSLNIANIVVVLKNKEMAVFNYISARNFVNFGLKCRSFCYSSCSLQVVPVASFPPFSDTFAHALNSAASKST